MRAVILGAGLAFAMAVASAAHSTPALLLFGGRDHKTFLGCLNCGKLETSSVCNQFGNQGSQFNSESIWNQFGTYGSQFNTLSPWNQFSSEAPAIADKDGGFYGYLSANKYIAKRTTIAVLNTLTDLAAGGTDLVTLRDKFCDD